MLPHRRLSRLINFILVACLVGFVFLFLQRPGLEEQDVNSVWAKREHLDLGRAVAQLKNIDEDVVTEKEETEKGSKKKEMAGSLQKWLKQPVVPVENDGKQQKVYESEEQADWERDLKIGEKMKITGREVVDSVNYLNNHFSVLNTDKFGDIDNVKIVIVIQVHSRLEYLRYLVDTLSKARGIEEILLVFSHDVKIPSIDHIVRNITFARVQQIFYPYNSQLFPHVFPGQDPNDCPEKIKRENAREMGCQNWEYPDKYGNYRVARFTQIKHHWWWKMNYVFDGIIDRKGLDPWVLLLEEDHYVSPDAVYTLKNIIDNRQTLCADCELISLGFYLKTYSSYGTNIDRLGVHPWFSSKHNMGMALTKQSWSKIKNCSELFCSWDDYNWDWSLLQISVKCLPQRFKVIFAKAPRVLHVGDCGVHTHRCAVHNAADAAANLFKEHEGRLFPREFKVTEVSRRMLKPSKENGGWGDSRDRALCSLNTHPLRLREESGMNSTVLEPLFRSSVSMDSLSPRNRSMPGIGPPG